MNIWILNNYNMLPEQGGLVRHYNFAKCLAEKGHHVSVFVGSHPHNTDLQMIQDRSAWKIGQKIPFRWIYVRTLNYAGSRIKQIFSMFQFYRNGKKAALAFFNQGERPDIILGSSAHPLAAVLAIRLAKRFRCKSIAEVRDLWPESIVAYGIAGPHNPAVLALRRLEKWIYKRADALVFTMEGAYDYITEQGWEAEIPRSKVHYINNGVDLEQFDYNKEHFPVDDADLLNPELFKIVFAGTLVLSNNIDGMLDLAKRLQKYPNVRFLIWGNGEYTESMLRRIDKEQINNVCYKGFVNKKYVPFIVSHADVNFMHGAPTSLYRYGASPNKLFDYLAAGRPIFQDFTCNQDIVQRYHCGISCDWDLDEVTEAFEKLYYANKETVSSMCTGAQKAAEDYDFKHLTEKLLQVIEGIRKL